MIQLFSRQSEIAPKKPFTKDKTTLNNNAGHKPETLNPGTTEEAKSIIKALIIKVNNPKVRMFIGKVNKVTIGLIIKLISDNTTATTTAVKNPFTLTPGMI